MLLSFPCFVNKFPKKKKEYLFDVLQSQASQMCSLIYQRICQSSMLLCLPQAAAAFEH